MANEEKRQQVIALGRLGWSLRRIEAEAGVRRGLSAVEGPEGSRKQRL